MPGQDDVRGTFRFADDDDDLGGFGGGSSRRRSRYDEEDDDEGGWALNEDTSDQLWDSTDEYDDEEEDVDGLGAEGAEDDEDVDVFSTGGMDMDEDLDEDEDGPLVRAPGKRGRPKGSGKKPPASNTTSSTS